MSDLLGELVEGASGDSVAVSTLLRKVKVLASRTGVSQLEEWVDHELSGYPSQAQIPKYRGPFEMEVLGTFGGPFGQQLQNAPIPSAGFPDGYDDGALFNTWFNQPIAEIEKLAMSSGPLQSNWPANAIALTNRLIQRQEVHLYPGMGLQAAWQTISPTQLGAVADSVRTRILELALSLERDAPNAGTRGASVPDSVIHHVVTNIYGGTANVAVGSRDVSQAIDFNTPTNLNELLVRLGELGITEEELTELNAAIEADSSTPEKAGPNVSHWLGRVMFRLSAAGSDVVTGAGGGLIAQLLYSYLTGPHQHG